MIFVYPAIMSDTVDSRIAPAVMKSLEAFFLLHLQQAFSSGTLKVKTQWMPSKKDYGPLQLEARVYESFKLLMEADAKDGIPYEEVERENKRKEIQKEIDDADVLIKQYTSQISAIDQEASQLRISYPKIKASKEAYDKIDTSNFDQTELDDYNSQKAEYDAEVDKQKSQMEDGQKEKKNLADKVKNLETNQKSDTNRIKTLGSDSARQIADKEFRDKREDKRKEEDEIRKAEKHKAEKDAETQKAKQRKGEYDVEPVQGLDYRPTMANIKVPIHYVGGAKKSDSNVGEIGNRDSKANLAIGSKVLISKVIGSEEIQNAILDDIFAKKSSVKYISTYRKFVRKATSYVSKVSKLVFSKNIDVSKREKNTIKREVFYAPSGFISASSFRKGSGIANFYNYTAAILVFNKDDLMEEGQNFFMNRSKVSKLFKMGWNTFCVLDPISEEAYLISSIDGGHLHKLPYRYMFNALKMDKIYEDLDTLRRSHPVFSRSVGNFNTLARRIQKESVLLKSMRRRVNG